jgi:hypothetical protein
MRPHAEQPRVSSGKKNPKGFWNTNKKDAGHNILPISCNIQNVKGTADYSENKAPVNEPKRVPSLPFSFTGVDGARPFGFCSERTGLGLGGGGRPGKTKG